MSNPQRYLVDDEEQARRNREMIKNRENIECYPVYAEEKMKCPHCKNKGSYDYDIYICDINDKFCLVEHGYECEEYARILIEEEFDKN